MNYLSKFLSIIPFIFYTFFVSGQETRDTASIQPINIHAYFSTQPLLGLTTSAQSINELHLQRQQTHSLLSALNEIAGLRMEERSPGSYRLAMRGSLIRSPFGIRNAKIYIDEFPLTDAGGNTYLNLIDPFSIHSIHVLKGPDGSLYGANSGGVVRIDPKGFSSAPDQAEVLFTTGAYGLFQEQLSLQKNMSDTYQFSFDQSFQRSDGYRDQTALNKKTFQTAHRWRYHNDNVLKLFLLYSDLGYQTPGGLTDTQFQENPRMARPAAGPNPGAKEQHAGIYNKTLFGGISHTAMLSSKLSHHISLFGSHTDLKNPFITNFEVRAERNLGIRTYLSFAKNKHARFSWQMQAGFEGQKGWNMIENYDNNKGVRGNEQNKDDLYNAQASLFYRAMAKIANRWTVEGSIGLNTATINYVSHYPKIIDPNGEIDFGHIWMPRFASSYLINSHVAIRASVSKGYSAPTLAEVRSSDNQINTELQAETGVNYELGVRLESKNRRLLADVSAYTYQMDNGIVRQLRNDGAEYYVNAGKIDQKGVEAMFLAHILSPSSTRLVKQLDYQTSLARNFYEFDTYQIDNEDFTGNAVTAVPDWTVTNSLSFTFPANIQFHIFHNYVSSMPLNDANTVYADAFHLVQAKAGITFPSIKKLQLHMFAGVDNLLNERYSLGNDINAFGNRFFNPAPPRNFYGGVRISWKTIRHQII
ncbi:TonB-dependent receptor [Sphingobacterium suaedae]|uniref:TonB-dependent receptor n=1 Tax=Sphingobacterium suaedae TaxID=1686402 RepID=A0ABW5KJT0_9SPHI